MVERCALSGSDLKIKFRTIILTSILSLTTYLVMYYIVFVFQRLVSLHGV